MILIPVEGVDFPTDKKHISQILSSYFLIDGELPFKNRKDVKGIRTWFHSVTVQGVLPSLRLIQTLETKGHVDVIHIFKPNK